jgi:hypothetical protein
MTVKVNCPNCGGLCWDPFSGTYADCTTCQGRGVLSAELAQPVTERDVVAQALRGARRLGWRWHDSWDQGSGWRQIELRPPGSAKASFIPGSEVWRFEAPLRVNR